MKLNEKFRIKIRIGNQTNCHTAAMVPFFFAIENGFDVFEWFSDTGKAGWNERLSDKEQQLQIKASGIEHDISFSVHAPWRSDPTTAAGLAEIKSSMKFAENIAARLVNFHLFPQYEAEGYVAAILPILSQAAGANLQISLENVSECAPEYINQIFNLLAQARCQNVGLCFDIGHANLFCETRGNFMNYAERISENVPIIHLHAHENFGDADSHLPIFTGPAASDVEPVRKLAAYLKERGFSGSIIMEQWPQPPEILVTSRNRLKGFLQG